MADPHATPHAAPHAPHETKPKRSANALVSNILALAGFAILIIIVIWGLFHLATLSTGWFSGLFNSANSKDAITVTAPESVVSNRAAKISWQHQGGDGRYAFLYECTEGLQFGIPLVKQGETTPTLARVPCGTAFTLGNATSSLLVVPVLAGTDPIVANINIVFVPAAGGTQASGSARMTVTATGAAAKKPEDTIGTATGTPRPSTGPADLVVTVTGASTDGAGFSIVTFDIANVGGSASGGYTFNANLPTSQPYTFYSEPQASLAPGEHIINTLRFTQTTRGTFTVVVDPQDMVKESNETNNVTSHEMFR